MKRFLRTFLIFLSVVLLITVAVNELYIYKVNQRPDTMSINKNTESEIRNVPKGIRICNFGSSHGLMSFIYDDVNDCVCFNFGQSSQFISYDYRILQNYIDRFEKGAYVFITVSHFSLFGPQDTEYENFQSLNKRYYKILPEEFIKEYDAKTDFFVNYAPTLAADDMLSIFETIFASYGDDAKITCLDEKDASEKAYKRYKTFIADKLDENGDRLYNNEEIEALYDMIDLCKEHDLVPILITTPYTSAYNEQVKNNDPAFYDDFYELIGEIVKNTGVPYYDYSCDERFSTDYSLFSDSDHLNANGARKFTAIVIKEVINMSA